MNYPNRWSYEFYHMIKIFSISNFKIPEKNKKTAKVFDVCKCVFDNNIAIHQQSTLFMFLSIQSCSVVLALRIRD